MEEKAVALLAHFEPGAGNPVPSQRLAHGELEGLGGYLRCIETQRDGAARLASALDGEVLPSRRNDPCRCERGG
jgi:hypothetical protein